MNDYYTEQLVKQKTKTTSILAKVALIAVTVLSFLVVLWIPFGIILPVGMIVLDVFLFKRMDLEFEYLYVNGDLDVDKIMARQTRKKVFETNMRDVEVVAPSGSIELQPFQRVKTYDYSSRTGMNQTYELVTVKKGHTVKIIFEPNQKILDGMKLLAPRKVFI